MDKQLTFFLVLSVTSFAIGLVLLNFLLQLLGIVIIFFLIHQSYFPVKKITREKTSSESNLIIILGNIDLILGILLLIDGTYGKGPLFLIVPLSTIIMAKGIIFVWGKDFASILDIIFSAIIILFITNDLSPILEIFIAIYFLQKGALSILFN